MILCIFTIRLSDTEALSCLRPMSYQLAEATRHLSQEMPHSWPPQDSTPNISRMGRNLDVNLRYLYVILNISSRYVTRHSTGCCFLLSVHIRFPFNYLIFCIPPKRNHFLTRLFSTIHPPCRESISRISFLQDCYS